LNPCYDGGLVGEAPALCFSRLMTGGFLGIDISKDKFDAYCIDIDGEKQFYLSCLMDRAGFEKLMGRLETLSVPR